ncbi:MAG: hypothetical protein KAG97_00105, partial [Victivallales bacterium]|nr:hypothetical protein [Victivallales bacterium]
MSNSDSKPLRSGWGVETIRTLAPSRRVGGEFFNLGRRPGISVVRQNGKDLLIVGDEFGYLQIYEDFLSPNPKILNSDKIGLHNDHEPLGAPAGSNPDANIYPTAYPSQCEGEFDIIAYYHAQREICHNARISDEPPLNFTWHWSVLAASGIPAVFRPERDARTELLVGGFDGTLRRHALVNSQKTKATCLDIGTDLEFSADGEVVFAGDEPIHFDDWCYPCIVDWDGQGTQDLLVGTAEGLLYLFRDIGDETHLIFERPVLLQASSGTVKADSFAAPAVLQGENGVKGVLLAGGGGEIHYHPRESRETLISKDIAAIFAESSRISRDTYKKGEWWLRQQLPESENGQMLTNCPVTGDQSEIFPEIVMENLPDDLTINVDFPGKHEIHITFFEP